MISDLWYGSSGPRDAKIVFVAESWGREEEVLQRPLVGSSGTEFDRILSEIGLSRHEVLCLNVISARPHANETFRFFLPKEGARSVPRVGGLLPSDFVKSEVKRLYTQIAAYPRALVVGMGNYALWALTARAGAKLLDKSNNKPVPPELRTYTPRGILSWRSSHWYIEPHVEFLHSTEQERLLRQTKFLPIIHPAAIMRAWYHRACTVNDLRARIPRALADDWRRKPAPVIYAPPTYEQVCTTLCGWLYAASRVPLYLANDIETVKRTYISVIGFASGPDFAISIPFVRMGDRNSGFSHYWSVEHEAYILALIRRILLHPNIRIIGQNYIYDTQFLQHWLGVTPKLYFDTMLCQNVLFPGTPKDLIYLSSLYCDYHWYWSPRLDSTDEEAGDRDFKDWDKIDDLTGLLVYNGWDCLRTYEVFQNQQRYITLEYQQQQMNFKMRTSELCLRMMNRGVLVDQRRRTSLVYDMNETLSRIQGELLRIVPQDMVKPHTGKKTDKYWFRSAKQTATLFYEILGFPVQKHPKTGQPTVGKLAIPQLRKKYPEWAGLFSRLDYYASIDNTAHVLQTPLEPDGRMRCSYNPGGTETHRLSSSENVFGRGTNLQNLTKGDED